MDKVNKLDIEKEELDKKVNILINEYDYYSKLVEDLKNMFTEYEVLDNIICFSSCDDINNETGLEIDVENLHLNFCIEILSINSSNIFKFSAVDFNKKDTEFNVTIFKDEKEINKYISNSIEKVKKDIIMWLICCI